MTRLFIALALVVGVGCGGTQETVLDESGDLNLGPSARIARNLEGTQPGGAFLNGTRWGFVSAECTVGPLDLSAREMSREMRVYSAGTGNDLFLVYDQTFAAPDACQETVVQRMTQGASVDEDWMAKELARVSLPNNETCQSKIEPERPADVRVRGDFLEVYVQRSVWCNGYEVKMEYQPLQEQELTGEELVRHWSALFAMGDAAGIAQLFADSGSLVDPFTLNPTGGPTRYEGRASVLQWFAQRFGAVSWHAFRLVSLEALESPGQFVASWEYMDPRVTEPFPGKSYFTIAAGEIFETRFEVDDPPAPITVGGQQGATSPDGAEGESDGEEGSETSASDESESEGNAASTPAAEDAAPAAEDAPAVPRAPESEEPEVEAPPAEAPAQEPPAAPPTEAPPSGGTSWENLTGG